MHKNGRRHNKLAPSEATLEMPGSQVRADKKQQRERQQR
jgi:hypothetical protein